MAGRFDVGGLLAEGEPAVEVMTDYASACRLLGCANCDPAQLRDLYTSEDGMDLASLDADCAALTSAVTTALEAVRLQDEARLALAGAWHGAGADAAAEFVQRQADSATVTVAALRNAADTLAELRDTLWQLVDGKVTASQEIEGRSGGARSQWWPAARTVITGAGAGDSASELVDQQVQPFVTNDIGDEWISVMRTTVMSILRAYDTAANGMAGELGAAFEVPSQLAPPPIDVAADVPTGAGPVPGVSAVSPPTAPAAVFPPPAAIPAMPPPAPAMTAPMPDPLAAAPALPSATGPGGGGGGGMPSLGTGLSGLGQQLADLIGGLLGSGSDAVPDSPGLDGPESDSLDEEDEKTDEDGDEDAAPDEVDDDAAAGEVADDEAVDDAGVVVEPEGQLEPPPPEPAPAPAPAPASVAAPVPQAPEAAPAATPCEIAADELPQAGP